MHKFKGENLSQKELCDEICKSAESEQLVLELIRLKKPNFGEIGKAGRKRKGYKVNPVFNKFNGK
jgi:hypothetical protein